MDELTFRREAYANPHNQQAEFLAAMQASDQRVTFVNDLKQLDKQLEAAMKVELPEGLEAKLLLNQQLHRHQQQRRKIGFVVTLAASIAFIAGIGFSLLRLSPVDLGQHALAHVYHEVKAMQSEQNISFNSINTQLASLSGLNHAHFTQQPGRVLYSSYCDFQGVRSLHLVMQTEQGKVSVFIVPKEQRMTLAPSFADKRYQGMGFNADNAYLVLVAENKNELSDVKEEIKQAFI
ncbi:DUF3379 family protein [Shewanella sp. Isolate11]|uniref:DUF3379 family protein n=1 Tax=Shewanella sp. Isolate11 TaxID=2908530 RepID=UPI001EFD2A0C|nr:DUF3379 family protein [Shewanella sp. Isolate11]MCG9696286.1 DUF3379 domain-containing protein [Shewanella sp. Isolate11]